MTGVQTCALPICTMLRGQHRAPWPAHLTPIVALWPVVLDLAEGNALSPDSKGRSRQAGRWLQDRCEQFIDLL